MMYSHVIRRRIRRSARWVLTASLTLICVSYLLAADIKRVSPEEAMKAVASRAQPERNAIAKQLNLSGSVGLDVTIAEGGAVEAVSVVRGNPVLAMAAMQAMKKWTFIPFKSDGKAIKVVTELVIKFNPQVE